jgi:hypothetical protein
MSRWRVDIIRKRAEHLGTVEAVNAQEAKKLAARQFAVAGQAITNVRYWTQSSR